LGALTVKPKQLDAVPLGRIFLQLANPRHDPFENEAQVIEYLCEDAAAGAGGFTAPSDLIHCMSAFAGEAAPTITAP
jgi:hypothetical protein